MLSHDADATGVCADRGLQMLKFMRPRAMVPTHETWQALVTGSARASKAATALRLYLEMRHLGNLPTTRCAFSKPISYSCYLSKPISYPSPSHVAAIYIRACPVFLGVLYSLVNSVRTALVPSILESIGTMYSAIYFISGLAQQPVTPLCWRGSCLF